MAALDTETINIQEDNKEQKRTFSSRGSLTAASDERLKKTKEEEASREDQRRGRSTGSAAAPKGASKGKEEKKDGEQEVDKKKDAKKEAIARKKREADFRPGQKKLLTSLVKQCLKNS